eukprot:gene4513-7891_t
MKSLLLLICFFLVAHSEVLWWSDGHELIADIASKYLFRNVQQKVNTIFEGKTLASQANWADKVSKQPKWSFSKTYHFGDVTDDSCRFDERRDCPAPRFCVVPAISNYTKQLTETNPENVKTALRFVVHFLGDIHQPLHVGRKKDFGGNRITVNYFGKRTNLHKVWDGEITERRIKADFRGSSRVYLDFLLKRLNADPWKSQIPNWLSCRDGSKVCPAEWALETGQISCKYAYEGVRDGDRLAEPYYQRSLPITEEQLVKAAEENFVQQNSSLSETELLIQESTRDFAKKIIQPKVREMDENEEMNADILKKCFDQGLCGLEIPEKYGGSELNFMSAILAIEELAKVDPSVSVCLDIQNTLINTVMLKYGNEKQKDYWLPKLATDTIGSFCLSEAGSGSDAFALRTKAEEKSDHYVLNGEKMWISNSKEAGLFIVMANVDFSKGYKGITAFIVDKSNPGLKIGKKEKKLGLRASSTCSVILEDCIVSKENVLGKVGEGYKIAISTLNEGRIGIGAQMIGLARGAFDNTMPYLLERKQFGTALADFQGMEFQYAQEEVSMNASRLLILEAARKKEVGMDIMKDAAMAKLYASQVANQVAMKCVEMLGGVGFTREFIVEKFYRDCIVGKIYEGTSNICLKTIAQMVKKEYKN